MKLALLGASGFVGTATYAHLCANHSVFTPSARLPFDQLVDALREADTVINCAGAARPQDSFAALSNANVDLPKRLAEAAFNAGVGRFVHVSSAAVQGDKEVLDESDSTQPFSDYSRSKALAEEGLLGPWKRPDCTVVYRPASILGHGRALTHTIGQVFGGPIAPVFGPGTLPLPTALVERCAEALGVLATEAHKSGIALHPWDGTTQRRLAESFCRPGGTLVDLPQAPIFLRRMAPRLSGRAAAVWRRAELLLYGQRQEATYLAGLGFDSHSDIDSYRSLSRRVRQQ